MDDKEQKDEEKEAEQYEDFQKGITTYDFLSTTADVLRIIEQQDGSIRGTRITC